MNAAPTKHDESVASVSLDQSAPRHLRTVEQGELYFELFRNWITGLLQTAGHDIFRMKGVLSVASHPAKYVFHAVHMIFKWAGVGARARARGHRGRSEQI